MLSAHICMLVPGMHKHTVAVYLTDLGPPETRAVPSETDDFKKSGIETFNNPLLCQRKGVSMVRYDSLA